MGLARSSGIWARVKPRRGPDIAVPEELPKSFVGVRVSVQMELSREMPELMRSDPYPDVSQHRALNCNP